MPDALAIASSSCVCKVPPSAVSSSTERPSIDTVSAMEPLTVVLAAGDTTSTGTGEPVEVAESTELLDPVALRVMLEELVAVADMETEPLADSEGDAVMVAVIELVGELEGDAD